MMLKEKAREEIFKIRKDLSSCYFDELNNKFYDHFLKTDYLKVLKNINIGGYYSFEKECNIFKILKYLKKRNKISLSVIKKKNDKMVFKEWNCLVESLNKNELFKKFKIFEPKKECKNTIPDLVFVPAVAVNIYGDRVGYGAGYYDRTLKDLNCIKIATVFDFQVLNKKIQSFEYDIKMDYILTENEFIKIN